MRKDELGRLQKIEERINQIARDEMGLEFDPIEFDIIPQQKMFEIMAYGMPGMFTNWKYGRDYEKTRTIYERIGAGLPYEVVVNSSPPRAYLMKDNTIGLQALIVAHVVGHCAFFKMNRHHIDNDNTMASRLSNASKRFEDYEKKYGIDIVEATIDAGHAIMWHSNPWLNQETESEKLDRIFAKLKKHKHEKEPTEFGEFFDNYDDKVDIDREKWNNELYITLKNKTPVEPTADILRYIIDHSRYLSDWQKDILEVIRDWGKYIWPNITTKYMNEGFASLVHTKIIRRLTKEDYLTADENAECGYTDSLVKAMNPYSMNPYLIGFEIWKDIIYRWDKGRYGDWNNIENHNEKINYDDKSKKGWEKAMKVLRTSNDWMFMHDFLTPDLVKKLKMYMYVKNENDFYEELVVTDSDTKEIKDIIVRSFSHSGIPEILVENGNHNNSGELLLKHNHIGLDLESEYAQKTLNHIQFLWGENCRLNTKKAKTNAMLGYISNKGRI